MELQHVPSQVVVIFVPVVPSERNLHRHRSCCLLASLSHWFTSAKVEELVGNRQAICIRGAAQCPTRWCPQGGDCRFPLRFMMYPKVKLALGKYSVNDRWSSKVCLHCE
eukprot:COSAG02_NODE_20_length_53673_cov_86.864841_30_plen_109_part_00